MLLLGEADEVTRRLGQLAAAAPDHADLHDWQGTGHIAAFDAVAFERPGAVDEIGEERDARASGDEAAHRLDRAGAEGDVGPGREGGEELAGVLLGFVDREHDQRFGDDVAHRNDVGAGQPVAERQPEAIGRGLEDLGLQGDAVAQVGDDHDGDVELAANQQMLEIVAIVLDGGDVDVGIGAAVAGEKIGEHIARHQRGDAELQRAARRRHRLAKTPPRIGDAGEDAGGMPVELVAAMGDGEAAPVPLEQGDAEIVLEFLDRVGDRRLADRQRLRRCRDGAFLGDRDEILQLPQRERHCPQ